MTIEERADRYVQQLSLPSVERTYYASKEDYIAGATEQKAEDDKRYEEYLAYMNERITNALTSQRKSVINNACEWLKNNYGHFDGSTEDLTTDFRKALEGLGMTIEERAKEYYPKGIGVFTPEGAELLQKAYINGATEQKAIDIEVAVAWLRKYVRPYYKFSIEEFKRAMEE